MNCFSVRTENAGRTSSPCTYGPAIQHNYNILTLSYFKDTEYHFIPKMSVAQPVMTLKHNVTITHLGDIFYEFKSQNVNDEVKIENFIRINSTKLMKRDNPSPRLELSYDTVLGENIVSHFSPPTMTTICAPLILSLTKILVFLKYENSNTDKVHVQCHISKSKI